MTADKKRAARNNRRLIAYTKRMADRKPTGYYGLAYNPQGRQVRVWVPTEIDPAFLEGAK